MGKKKKSKKLKRAGKKNDFFPLLMRTLNRICSNRITFLPFAALCLMILSIAIVEFKLIYPIAFVVWLIATYIVCDMYKDIPAGRKISFGKFKRSTVKDADFTEER